MLVQQLWHKPRSDNSQAGGVGVKEAFLIGGVVSNQPWLSRELKSPILRGPESQTDIPANEEKSASTLRLYKSGIAKPCHGIYYGAACNSNLPIGPSMLMGSQFRCRTGPNRWEGEASQRESREIVDIYRPIPHRIYA